MRQGTARSRNAFAAAALRRELAVRARRAIDEAVEAMAADEEARAEALRLDEEFRRAGWEALREAER